MRRFILPILLLIFGFTSLSSQASAQHPSFTSFEISKNNGQSLNGAVRKIKKRTGGRILAARTITKKGRAFHKIKVLMPSGKVRVFKVDAR